MATKGQLIIEGLRRARCKYCGRPGQTVLCRCKTNMKLARLNHRMDTNPLVLAGPMGKLP